MPVHQRHVELEFKVREGAESADDGGGVLLAREFDQQAVETDDADRRHAANRGSDQLDPLFGAEQRVLRGAEGHGHCDMVEQFGGAQKHVEVTVGERVECAGVDTEAHGRDGGLQGRRGKRGRRGCFVQS